eukprot:1318651-Amorphochlora_amoeboformis.AAC.4
MNTRSNLDMRSGEGGKEIQKTFTRCMFRLPSPRNQYLFNGDWVDRGDCGVEIVLYPEAIFLNRGNHEATDVNSDVDTYAMCFYKECMQKYDREIYDLFSEAFAACPIATVINNKFFVVHGGLCHKYVKIS